MPFNQPRSYDTQTNQINKDEELSLEQGRVAINNYINILKNNESDYNLYRDFGPGTDGYKYIQKLQKILSELQMYPSAGSKIYDLLDSKSRNWNIHNHVNTDKIITEIEDIFKESLPQVRNIKRDTTHDEILGPEFMKDRMDFGGILKLKALGPETASFYDISYAIIDPILKDKGSNSKQALAVKFDKVVRSKKINLDLKLSNANNASLISIETVRSFEPYGYRLKDIIEDSKQAFETLTGRQMKPNESEIMLSNLEAYKARFTSVKNESFVARSKMLQEKTGLSDRKIKFSDKQKVEDLVTLVKACEDFVNDNRIYSELKYVNDKKLSTKFFDKKDDAVQIILKYNALIDKCQEFLLTIGDSNFTQNYISENSENNSQSNITPHVSPDITRSQTGQEYDATKWRTDPNQTIQKTQQNSNQQIQNEIPTFQRPISEREVKVETVETTIQFVNKYFKSFDAFLITSVDRAKINNEDVLKFTGEGHKGGEINKNSYVKVPITGLSKFELQTLGKIAEKYNTVEGVQIWMGNEQIGFLDKNGQMLELLQ
jgi:hypothetical protein